MIAPLRRLHLRIWTALAVLLPLILIAGLAARRPEPGNNILPAAARATEAQP